MWIFGGTKTVNQSPKPLINLKIHLNFWVELRISESKTFNFYVFKTILPWSQSIATSIIKILSHNVATFKFPIGFFFWYARSKRPLLACKLTGEIFLYATQKTRNPSYSIIVSWQGKYALGKRSWDRIPWCAKKILTSGTFCPGSACPSSKTGTKGSLEPGQKAYFVVVSTFNISSLTPPHSTFNISS